MGVDVVLNWVSQPGTSPKRRRLEQVDVVPDSFDEFAGICARSKLPMLSRVDPYGTVVLTAAEMPQLITEVDLESRHAATESERVLLAEIRRRAEQCATHPSAELHLEGD